MACLLHLNGHGDEEMKIPAHIISEKRRREEEKRRREEAAQPSVYAPEPSEIGNRPAEKGSRREVIVLEL